MLSGKALIIFVEGPSDLRFFERVIAPRLRKKYAYVKIREYAGLKKERINDFIRSINRMPEVDYVYVADIDNIPCVTAKKQGLQQEYKNIDDGNIAIAIKEIEGWYLAGLTGQDAGKLGVKIPTKYRNTNEITKEQFCQLIPKKFDSRIDFMTEILKNFSLENAVDENRSFSYFVENFMKI